MGTYIDHSPNDWGVEVLDSTGKSLGKFKDCWADIGQAGSLQVSHFIEGPGVGHQTGLDHGYEWVAVFAAGAWARVNRIAKDNA